MFKLKILLLNINIKIKNIFSKIINKVSNLRKHRKEKKVKETSRNSVMMAKSNDEIKIFSKPKPIKNNIKDENIINNETNKILKRLKTVIKKIEYNDLENCNSKEILKRFFTTFINTEEDLEEYDLNEILERLIDVINCIKDDNNKEQDTRIKYPLHEKFFLDL